MAAARPVARDDAAACTCPLYVGGDPACYYHGLRDRHLPDLLAVDAPDWQWPHACHDHGHVWEVGGDRCIICRAPYAEFGPEVRIVVAGSERVVAVGADSSREVRRALTRG